MTKQTPNTPRQVDWRVAIGAVALALIVSAAPVAAAVPGYGSATITSSDSAVSPESVDATLEPGESIEVEKTVGTPDIPPKADIFLLEDESGSFGDDITNLQTLAPAIWDNISATGTDFTMGVAGFRDFNQSSWGWAGDWVYDRNQDLTTDRSAFLNGVNNLTASGGADFPEAQLEALHYIANTSHAAIDSDGDGNVSEPEDTPVGQQPSWRSGASRIVLMATDAPCHVTGDSGGWPGDAGTTSPSTTASILDDQNITVIGLTPNGEGDIACVDTLANQTGGSVHATGSAGTGENVSDAILDGLEEVEVEVTHSVSSDEGLSVSFDQDSKIVTSGENVTFNETISVADNDSLRGETLTAEVTFYVDGEAVGTETITVKVPAKQVDIDVKPGSDPNSINCNNDNEVISVAILSTADFDATTVDHTTVTFEGANETHVNPRTGEPRRHEEDVDGDGDTDLVFHFRVGETDLTCDSINGTLTGETFDGGAIEGTDSVRMIDRGGGGGSGGGPP